MGSETKKEIDYRFSVFEVRAFVRGYLFGIGLPERKIFRVERAGRVSVASGAGAPLVPLWRVLIEGITGEEEGREKDVLTVSEAGILANGRESRIVYGLGIFDEAGEYEADDFDAIGEEDETESPDPSEPVDRFAIGDDVRDSRDGATGEIIGVGSVDYETITDPIYAVRFFPHGPGGFKFEVFIKESFLSRSPPGEKAKPDPPEEPVEPPDERTGAEVGRLIRASLENSFLDGEPKAIGRTTAYFLYDASEYLEEDETEGERLFLSDFAYVLENKSLRSSEATFRRNGEEAGKLLRKVIVDSGSRSRSYNDSIRRYAIEILETVAKEIAGVDGEDRYTIEELDESLDRSERVTGREADYAYVRAILEGLGY